MIRIEDFLKIEFGFPLISLAYLEISSVCSMFLFFPLQNEGYVYII